MEEHKDKELDKPTPVELSEKAKENLKKWQNGEGKVASS